MWNPSLHLDIKGKAIQLWAWSGPEGSRKLRFQDFMTTALEGGKVVSFTHRLHIYAAKCYFSVTKFPTNC